MWQREIGGVAHYTMDCFEVLGALDDLPASTSFPSAQAWNKSDCIKPIHQSITVQYNWGDDAVELPYFQQGGM